MIIKGKRSNYGSNENNKNDNININNLNIKYNEYNANHLSNGDN